MKLRFLALALASTMLHAQAVHFGTNVTQPSGNVPVGAAAPVYTVPNAFVTVCGYPAVGNPCTNTVPIYSDQGLTHQIPQPFQADGLGRFDFWVPSGTYSYSLQTQSGKNVGSYIVTLIASSGDATWAQTGDNIATLCGVYSGNPGTVFVSVPLSVATATLPANCSINMLSGGLITVSGGLTINGPFSAGTYQTFSGAGTVSFGNQSVDDIRPQWWGALANGAHNDSPAIQKAIDTAAASSSRKIRFAPGNYLLNVALNVTSGSDVIRDGITFTSEGRRGGVYLTCNTGAVCIDLSGTAWTTWNGLFVQNNGGNPSTAAFFLAGTNTRTESLYHTFSNMTVQMYLPTYSIAYGAVDFLVVGSEENSFGTSNITGNTNFVFTTHYSIVSTDYKSPFRHSEIQAAHSCGMNTFYGQNSLVTFDAKNPNIVLYGANSINFGDTYMANVNIGTPGTVLTALRIIGGTLEDFRGHTKTEGKNLFLEVFNSQIFGWELQHTFGATPSSSLPVVLFHADTASIQEISDFKLQLNYYDPAAAAFAAKPIFATTGTFNAAQIPVINDIYVSVNQTMAQYATYPWPAWFVGPMTNGELSLKGNAYTTTNQHHTMTLPTVVFLGNANSTTPVNLATVHLPPLSGSTNANAITVRLTGNLSSINPGTSGGDPFVATCPVDTMRGAWSIAAGAVTVGTGTPSDSNFPALATTCTSTSPGLTNFSGVNLGLVYNAGPRTITVNAYPLATGANISTTPVWIRNMKFDLLMDGKTQTLTYLSN